MSDPDSMYGVVNGFYECNMERTEELNKRLNSRNVLLIIFNHNIVFVLFLLSMQLCLYLIDVRQQQFL